MKLKSKYCAKQDEHNYNNYIAEIGWLLGKETNANRKAINERFNYICDNLQGTDGIIIFQKYCQYVAKKWWERTDEIELIEFLDLYGKQLLIEFEKEYLEKDGADIEQEVELELIDYMKGCFYDEDNVTDENVTKFVKDILKKHKKAVLKVKKEKDDNWVKVCPAKEKEE